jgi:purine-nucleoside phosphorylase
MAQNAAEYINGVLPETIPRPRIGIICGSGLGGLVSTFHADPQLSIPYADIPNFPVSTVQGHESRLVFGTLGEKRTGIVAMVGRLHFYEGYDMATVTLPIRVFHLLGVDTIISTHPAVPLTIVTNAAGGLNKVYSVGDLVVLRDHINLPGLGGNHPLRGPNAEEFGPRFPPLSDAYSLTLRQTLFHAAKSYQIRSRRGLHEGIYAMVSGPSYETRAEAAMIRNMGADVVGMSTVPEVIVARHCGVQVLCISLVTNMVVLDPTPGGEDETVSGESMTAGIANHEEVLAAGREAAIDMQGLIGVFVDLL